MKICSLLKTFGSERVKRGFVKLNFKVAFPKEKKLDFPLLKEFLSKGGFLKPASEPVTLERIVGAQSELCVGFFPSSIISI